MEKLVIAITGAVTLVGAVAFLFGWSLHDHKPPARPALPPQTAPAPSNSAIPSDLDPLLATPGMPVPPQSQPAASGPHESAPAEPQLVCKECPNPASPTILEQDGISVTLSAEPEPVSEANPGAPPTGKVTVKIQSKKPVKVVPKQNYVLLSPENGQNYSLPLSEYRYVTPDGRTSSHTTSPDDPTVPVADAWPTVDDTVESELEFQFNLELLTGRFMVRAPDLMLNGKSYSMPAITFEPKDQP